MDTSGASSGDNAPGTTASGAAVGEDSAATLNPCALQRLDQAIARAQHVHHPDGPGFCLALVRGAQVLRQVHHGMAHLEWPQPITGRTRFYLASEAKPWTAALVMDAVADGRVGLDDDVRPWLPALAECTRPVRLGHLLRHTSGLQDYLGLWHAQLAHHEHDHITQSQALALIGRAGDVDFEPGTRHDYSNSNYVLLAELLQRLTGQDLASLARQRLFGPWGMHDTGFEAQPWRVLRQRARSYGRDPQGDWTDLPVPLGSWGDGGLWSTLDDLVLAEAQWPTARNAHPTATRLAQCCADDARFAPPGTPYRFGLEVAKAGAADLAFHGGGYAGFSSLVVRHAASATALVVLANAEGFDADAAAWIDAVWGEGGLTTTTAPDATPRATPSAATEAQ